MELAYAASGTASPCATSAWKRRLSCSRRAGDNPGEVRPVRKSPASREETKRVMRKNATSAVASLENVPAGLDWEAFSAAYFPGRRRHDLEALTAYGAYKRSRVIDERSAQEAARLEEAERTSAGTTAVDAWEDEGGSAP